MTRDQNIKNITMIKALLWRHEELLKEWHDASFGVDPNADDAYAIGEEMESLERDITFLAADIFLHEEKEEPNK